MMNVSERKTIIFVFILKLTIVFTATLPVGGMKGSGWGRNNALWGLKEFTDVKLITLSQKGNDFL